MKSTDRSTHYQICLEGKLEERWLRWFDGLEVETGANDQTIIRGTFDQSALHGLFNRIRDLGLELVSVHQQVSDDEKLKDITIVNQDNKEIKHEKKDNSWLSKPVSGRGHFLCRKDDQRRTFPYTNRTQ